MTVNKPRSIETTLRSVGLALAAATALTLTACGGGSSSDGAAPPSPPASQPPAPTTGTVGVLFRDGPTDEFCQILASVERIDLLGAAGPTNVFLDSQVIDILAMENYTDIVTVATEVPVGAYEKVRLTLSDLALVECDGEGNPEPESGWEHPKLPGNGKLDLNPRGSFQVVGGETLLIQIDLDMNKSLHLHQTGNGNGKWQFRPVIFVDIVPDGQRLVRVFGQVRDVNGMTFELCPLEPASSVDGGSAPGTGDMSGDDDSGRCLDVFVDPSTGIFNEAGDPASEAGEPVGMDKVVNGGLLTAIGFLSLHDDDDDGDSKADDLRLDAVVLELGDQGTFERIRGAVAAAPGNNGIFEFDPSAVADASDVIDVLLQAGTRTFALGSNEELTSAALQPGTLGEVDGVFTDLPTDPVTQRLNAALIVLDVDATPDRSILEATIAAIAPDNDAVPETREITVDTSGLAGQCVTTDAATRYLTITQTADSSETADAVFADLLVGDSVDVYGTDDLVKTGCVLASVIQRYVEPPPPTP
jgi:hypothetical protein